jgi:hypothetical protein
MSAENRQLFGEPPERLDERIEFAGSQKFIETPEAEQDALLNLAAHPLVIHDEQIRSGSVGLRAYKQNGTPVSLSLTQVTANNNNNLRHSAITRDTRISSWGHRSPWNQ